ncbi:type IV pili methyl-accepting chemotaxis transducer N-terminal domain-containing protein [Halomonas elongata]|uniref:type IV pili methyl-accepting chemotaxis transducer N-terminal domain-containing protein n=1 Tax=Halomonas elongata TaxID=2746 RepID=UPI00186BAC9E|nr:type IV pili methyl-accepting chemotaxis transducer N-terminal domain-containing protein [Halomonas elongata]MBW5801756.1 type IV pili methyl-accepting chemotaxis transducer N-terminal domain-containing protein [Halomonas elongata]
MKLLQRSLAARITASLLAISAMALISIAVTTWIASGSRGDAATINWAGSLRMNTYQVVTALQRYQHQPDAAQRQHVADMMERFTERLGNPQPIDSLRISEKHPIRTHYQQLERHWQNQLAPRIAATIDDDAEIDPLLSELERQVDDIDQMVSLLEQHSYTKLQRLATLQLFFLALTAMVVAIALYDIRHHLVRPLRQLVVLARETSRHNFNHRSHLQGDDELALLGRALDSMAEELGTSYAELQDRVSRKKQELARSNAAMQILHDGSRALYGGGNDLCTSAAPMLRRLEELLEIGPIGLSLHDPFDHREVPILVTHSPSRPAYCRDHDCNACLLDPSPEIFTAEGREGLERLLLPVSVGTTLLGTLEVYYSADLGLTDNTRRLLNALSDQLATAVYLQRRIEQQQQVTLMNERTIIARELHDSLAQSLSYLKIQVARLERMQSKGLSREDQAPVFDELRTGLDSAYRQLRELLTTFRLRFDSPGLQSSLSQTVAEFSERLGFAVEFDFDVPPQLLNPNEEIHVLQIVREALANILKHARAHWARISVRFVEAHLRVVIEDDGVGLESDTSPPMHHGLVIMRDRADTLGGNLQVRRRDVGGTLVALDFTPQTARLIAQQTA